MQSLKRLSIMNKLKKVNAIQANDTSDLVRKTDYDIKIGQTEKKIKDRDHSNKYITTHKISTSKSSN